MNLPASDCVAHLELAAGVHTEPDDLIGQRVAHNLLRLRCKRNLSL
ncbi:helix-turn-helix domain-containing protein, partial [Pseudomonas aeruginosa]